MRNVRIKLFSLIYGLIAITFCIYWSMDFSKHVHYKGDEFVVLVELLLMLTYTFYVLLQVFVIRINLLFLAVAPIITCIISVFTGFIILLPLSGVPREYILVYGLLYTLISIVASFRLWRQTNIAIS